MFSREVLLGRLVRLRIPVGSAVRYFVGGLPGSELDRNANLTQDGTYSKLLVILAVLMTYRRFRYEVFSRRSRNRVNEGRGR